MTKGITENLEIDCAPATAFDVMADVRNETKWNDDVSDASMTSDGPIGQGSTFTTDHGAPLGQIKSTITTYDRPGLLEFEATSAKMDLAISLRFIENGSGGTRMQGTFTPAPKGVMSLLFPLLRPLISRDMAKQHQNYKSLCESQEPSESARP